ncbi:MAG: hypothetical protein ACRCUY_03825 [Thermoguttaceae bacterium]
MKESKSVVTNQNDPDITFQQRQRMPSSELDSLYEIARYQRFVIYAVGCMLLSLGLFFVCYATFVQPGDVEPSVIRLVWIPCLISGIFFFAFSTILARKLGHPLIICFLLPIVCIFPLFALLVLQYLNSEALTRLKKAGYNPGFLGVNPKVIRP